MTNKQSEVKESTDEIRLEWIAHPAKQRPLAAVTVAIFILLVGFGVYSWTFSPLFTAFAVIVLAGSLAGFYFPTRYRLYDSYIEVKYTVTSMKREWHQFRTYWPDRNGVLLSPFPHKSRLENFRGLYLRYGQGDKGKILEMIKSKVEKRGDDGDS